MPFRRRELYGSTWGWIHFLLLGSNLCNIALHVCIWHRSSMPPGRRQCLTFEKIYMTLEYGFLYLKCRGIQPQRVQERWQSCNWKWEKKRKGRKRKEKKGKSEGQVIVVCFYKGELRSLTLSLFFKDQTIHDFQWISIHIHSKCVDFDFKLTLQWKFQAGVRRLQLASSGPNQSSWFIPTMLDTNYAWYQLCLIPIMIPVNEIIIMDTFNNKPSTVWLCPTSQSAALKVSHEIDYLVSQTIHGRACFPESQ